MFLSNAFYDPAPWSGFFESVVSATASLTGLLFVAISINLRSVVESENLVARSAKALLTLVGALLVAMACLIPAQPIRALAVEILVLGATLWVTVLAALRGANRNNPYVTLQHNIVHAVLALGSTLPFVAGGISLMLHRGGGLYWLVGGVAMSFLAALADAWVLLIEIQR